MDSRNYIVPIYKEKEFCGTGFIVGSILITAGHVVKSPTCNYSCIWEGNTITLSCANIIYYEYEGGYEQGRDNHYWDLAIYKVEGVESLLELSECDFNLSSSYQGFSFNENDCSLQVDIYNDIFVNDNARYYPKDGGKSIPIENCFLSDVGICKDGNSGGPLFQKGKVIGMLSGNQDYGDFSKDRFIKAEYIMSVLGSIDDKMKNRKSY